MDSGEIWFFVKHMGLLFCMIFVMRVSYDYFRKRGRYVPLVRIMAVWGIIYFITGLCLLMINGHTFVTWMFIGIPLLMIFLRDLIPASEFEIEQENRNKGW